MTSTNVQPNLETTTKSTVPKVTFEQAFKGKFYGVLKWKGLDDLWGIVKKDSKKGWYLYAIGEEPPTKLIKGKALHSVIN